MPQAKVQRTHSTWNLTHSLSLWYHAAWLMHIELLQLSGNSQILTKSLLNCLVFALNGVMIDCNADTWRSSTTLTAPTLFSSLQSLSFELQKSVFVNAKPDPRIHNIFSLWATFKNCEATWSKYTNDLLYSNDAFFYNNKFYVYYTIITATLPQLLQFKISNSVKYYCI